MKYLEIKYDPFKYVAEHKCTDRIAVAHCISRDIAMGAGIAKQFTKYGIRDKILANANLYDNFKYSTDICIMGGNHGTPIYGVQVHNIITKEHYYDKPTYESIYAALTALKYTILKYNPTIEELVMPRIGCGLDRLEWSKVSSIVKKLFSDTELTIVICVL